MGGKTIADKLKTIVKTGVEAFQLKNSKNPGLTVVIVGEDPASKVYVGRKHKACLEVGINSDVVRMAEDSSEEELLAIIDGLNANPAVHGILVQLPVPKHINSERVLERIRPMAMLLLARHATVTICHSRTKDLPAVCREGDILVAAIGKPNFVTKDMVKPGAVVIDVGINRVGDKLVGDVDFKEVQEVASYITPVPGELDR